MAEMLSCTGVVFQVNSEGALFEFNDGNSDDVIGFVKMEDIKLNSDSEIISTAKIQVGSELICTVTKSDDLSPFSFVEEDEEVGVDGEVIQTSRKVEIMPEWLACSAELVVGEAGKTSGDEKSKEKSFNEKTVDNDEVIEESKENSFDEKTVNKVIEKSEENSFDEKTVEKVIEKSKEKSFDEKTVEKVIEKSKEKNFDEEIVEKVNDEKTAEKFDKPSELEQPGDKEEKEVAEKYNEPIPVFEEKEIRNSDVQVCESSKRNEVGSEVIEHEEEITFIEEKVHFDSSQLGSVGLMLLQSYDEIDYDDMVENPGNDDVAEIPDQSSIEAVSEQEPSAPDNQNDNSKDSRRIPVDDGEENIAEVVKSETVNETFTESAKLVQLRKGNEWGKVVEAIFELTTGKHAKGQVTVSNDLIYVWGYHLNKANLMINLKFEDECIVRYKLITEDDITLPPSCFQIEKVWFGSEISSRDDPDFAAWLNLRNLTEKDFFKWIRNQAPPQPYFPLQAEIFRCNVVDFVVEGTDFCASKVLLQVGDKIDGKKSDKEEATTPKEGEDQLEQTVYDVMLKNEVDKLENGTESSDNKTEAEKTTFSEIVNEKRNLSNAAGDLKIDVEKIAILSRDDLYVGGVSVGYSNLRLLLRRGDLISCQIREIEVAEKDAGLPKVVTHIAYLGFVGSERPTKANLTTAFASHLENDLKMLGLNVNEFEALRFPVQTNGDSADLSGDKTNTNLDIEVANCLATKAISIDSSKSPQIFSLLKNPKEISVATKMSKILTAALLYQMQSGMNTAHLEGQMSQLKVVEEFFEKPVDKERDSRRSDSSRSISSRDVKTSSSSKSSSEKRRMSESSSPRSPLESLRNYILDKKEVEVEGDILWFGDVGFSKSIKTNYRASAGGEFYSLETLHHFFSLDQKTVSYQDYSEAAASAGISPVLEIDKKEFLNYMTYSKSYKPKNVERWDCHLTSNQVHNRKSESKTSKPSRFQTENMRRQKRKRSESPEKRSESPSRISRRISPKRDRRSSVTSQERISHVQTQPLMALNFGFPGTPVSVPPFSYGTIQYPEQTVFKSEDVAKIKAKAAEQEKLSIVELERIRLEQLRVEQLNIARKQKEEQDRIRMQQKEKRIRAHAEEIKRIRQKEEERLRQEEESARQWQLETERIREEKRRKDQEEEQKLFVRHRQIEDRSSGYSGYPSSVFPSEFGVSKSSIIGSVQRDSTSYEAGYGSSNYESRTSYESTAYESRTNYGSTSYEDPFNYRSTSYEGRTNYGTGYGTTDYNDRSNYGSGLYETRTGPSWIDPNPNPENPSNLGLALPNPINPMYRRQFDRPY